MSKKIKLPSREKNLDEARRILKQYDSRLPPDVPFDVIVRLLQSASIEFKSTTHGFLVAGELHVNLQHHKGGGNWTIHRKGFSQVLKFVRVKVEES